MAFMLCLVKLCLVRPGLRRRAVFGGDDMADDGDEDNRSTRDRVGAWLLAEGQPNPEWR